MKKSILIVALIVVFLCSICVVPAFALELTSSSSHIVTNAKFYNSTNTAVYDMSHIDDGNYRYYYRTAVSDSAYKSLYITWESEDVVLITSGTSVTVNIRLKIGETQSGSSIDYPYDWTSLGVPTISFYMENDNPQSMLFHPDLNVSVGTNGTISVSGSFEAPIDGNGLFGIQMIFAEPITVSTTTPMICVQTSLLTGFTYNGYVTGSSSTGSGSSGSTTIVDVDLSPIIDFLNGTLTDWHDLDTAKLSNIVNYLVASDLDLVYDELHALYELHNSKYATFEEFLSDIYSCITTFLPSIFSNTYTAVQRLEEIIDILNSEGIDTGALEETSDSLKSDSDYISSAEDSYFNDLDSALTEIDLDGFEFESKLGNSMTLAATFITNVYSSFPSGVQQMILVSCYCGLALLIFGCASRLIRR